MSRLIVFQRAILDGADCGTPQSVNKNRPYECDKRSEERASHGGSLFDAGMHGSWRLR